jgi:hypothetical protein
MIEECEGFNFKQENKMAKPLDPGEQCAETTASAGYYASKRGAAQIKEDEKAKQAAESLRSLAGYANQASECREGAHTIVMRREEAAARQVALYSWLDEAIQNNPMSSAVEQELYNLLSGHYPRPY